MHVTLCVGSKPPHDVLGPCPPYSSPCGTPCRRCMPRRSACPPPRLREEVSFDRRRTQEIRQRSVHEVDHGSSRRLCHPRLISSPAAIQPVCNSVWNDIHECPFEDLAHRRKYRLIYNKFKWWKTRKPVLQLDDNSCCSEELWQLGCKDSTRLSRRERCQLVRFFLDSTSAPHLCPEVSEGAVAMQGR